MESKILTSRELSGYIIDFYAINLKRRWNPLWMSQMLVTRRV